MAKSNSKKQIVLFEEKEVRRVWHDEQWYFAINDVVGVLTQTPNISDYLKR
jgi:prophage antirepressor-like protein